MGSFQQDSPALARKNAARGQNLSGLEELLEPRTRIETPGGFFDGGPSQPRQPFQLCRRLDLAVFLDGGVVLLVLRADHDIAGEIQLSFAHGLQAQEGMVDGPEPAAGSQQAGQVHVREQVGEEVAVGGDRHMDSADSLDHQVAPGILEAVLDQLVKDQLGVDRP